MQKFMVNFAMRLFILLACAIPSIAQVTPNYDKTTPKDVDGDGAEVINTKKMVTGYEWRGLPVKFKFYATAQDLPWNELVCHGLEKSGHKLVSEVRMAYDASGNRVLKTTYNKTSPN